MEFESTAGFAAQLDSRDELARFRDAFVIADPDLIYMDGNSLGRLSFKTGDRVRAAVEEEWGRELIRGWNKNWYEAPARVGEKIAKLIGAGPGQVLVTDSTSVNLFKLVMAALALRPERSRVISDAVNFPSDLYVLQGCIHLLGDRHHLHLVGNADAITVDQEEVLHAIDEQTALVVLSHVTFKSGFLYDMAAITRRADKLARSCFGTCAIRLASCRCSLTVGVDLAVGCSYKYLNGGPGAPAFLFVRRDLQTQALSPIWGWFGERNPFAFELGYQPAQGIAGFSKRDSPDVIAPGHGVSSRRRP